MLKINVEEKVDFTTFRLEGKLAGDWVRELERCWTCAKRTEPGMRFKVDLNGVSFVDEKGKALLESMVSEGVELLANNPMMTSLAQSIVENASAGSRGKDSVENNLPSNLLLGD